MTFSEKLKKARLEAGYTQEELAAILMVSRAAIAKWESNRGMPDILNLKSIAATLNVSVDYLLQEDGEFDVSITKKAIDLRMFHDEGTLSRIKKLEIKEKIIRNEYKDATITRLTLTKIKNNKKEKTADGIVGSIALVLGGIPLFGTQEFGKMMNSLDEQYYLVEDTKKQYFVLLTDEFMISKQMPSPIHDKKFTIGDKTFQTVGYVD